MAVGIGFLVGYTVKILGKGVSPIFGAVGGACALLGCILGNLLSICGFISANESVPLFQVMTGVLMQPKVAAEILINTFNPMDILFYAIAIYEGYKFSFRHISPEELNSISIQS